MKKILSIGLATIGVVLLAGLLGSLMKPASSIEKKFYYPVLTDINDTPLGI